MSDANGNDAGYLRFEASHQPGLTAGEYSITLEQWITTKKSTAPTKEGAATYAFSIAAPRFSLNPQDVSAVFPPAGSLGDHSKVLPHIQLERSTLPWERQPKGGGKDDPWLVLLVLHEDELGPGGSREIQSATTLDKLQTASAPGDGICWPGVTLEPRLGQHGEDAISIIDVDAKLLKKVFPGPAERKWLAHVRYRSDDETGRSGNEERSVIIGNRLPASGGGSVVYLVSLEGRDVDGEILRASDSQKVRLVSLYSWRFDCISQTHSFTGLLSKLNSTVLMPEHLTGAQQMPGVLRLPPVGNADAESYLARGAVALPHMTRLGNRTVSWYHGPFVPGGLSSSPPISYPIKAADKVLRYNSSIGMLDVSYAAAWELGRLLTLQNKPVATALYNWKRSHAQTDKLRGLESEWLHLDLRKQNAPEDLPRNVVEWFRDLTILRGVPFSYLVPDERMLPAESLGFFQIDSEWVQCLLDGAFSIGRVLENDHSSDEAHTNRLAEVLKPAMRASGLLLRSAVVSGWPDLLVDGFVGSDPLSKLREEKLSPSILLCLFENVVQKVRIHQKPEALHFGCTLRDVEGKQPHTVEVPVSDEGVVLWNDLVPKLGKTPVTSALLAYQLIEEVESVEFTVGEARG